LNRLSVASLNMSLNRFTQMHMSDFIWDLKLAKCLRKIKMESCLKLKYHTAKETKKYIEALRHGLSGENLRVGYFKDNCAKEETDTMVKAVETLG